MPDSLLVELLTEELPPKALSALGLAFANGIRDELVALGLAPKTGKFENDLATPRRLAVLVSEVAERAASEEREVTGPAASAPPAAVAGFAKKHGVAVEALQRKAGAKGEVFVARVKAGGAALDEVLAGVVDRVVRRLPIPKVMRWGDGDAQFVRPVHGLVMLHGTRVVPGSVLGLASGNRTQGHRFMGKRDITLARADEYVSRLRDEGSVVCRFAERKSAIERALTEQAAREDADLGPYQDLLNEVTALVEHPSVYVGTFPSSFLDVPQECLILTMRQNQKYFPLFDRKEKLLPRFLIVSNMKVADARHIIGGNERVVRPRLEDARFFYDQDRKLRLEARVPQLAKVVYHNKLGTQLERVQRVQLLAGKIARQLKADVAAAERAAWLSKADLLTGMVGEFPELQGVMGRYYALHDGEPRVVADAIEAHYRPRFAGDRLPEDHVALRARARRQARCARRHVRHRPAADRREGSVRPAPRRARRGAHPRRAQAAALAARAGRARRRAGVHPRALRRIPAGSGILDAAGRRGAQPESDAARRGAAAARGGQGLPGPARSRKPCRGKQARRQHPQAGARQGRIVQQDRAQDAEGARGARAVYSVGAHYEQRVPLYERGDYTGYLKSFAVLKQPVDAFFDSVMVMAKEDDLRHNRLALLRDLRDAMNRVADISKLAQ